MNWIQRSLREIRKPAYYFSVKCPGCQNKIRFVNTDYIKVNILSKGIIRSKIEFYQPTRRCNNPLCEWSIKHEDDDYNNESFN